MDRVLSSSQIADSELVSPVSAISSVFSSASPTPSSASPSSAMFASSVSPSSSANMGIFSPLPTYSYSSSSFSTLPPLKLIPLIPIPNASSSSSSKPPLAPRQRIFPLPPPSMSQCGSILSVSPHATVLAPSVLRSMKAKFLRGQSTAPPSQNFVAAQLETNSASHKRVVVGGPSLRVAKRQRLSHKSSFITPLLSTIEEDDVELAALAFARELVEFAANYNIIDDGGVDDFTIAEEEKQLAEVASSSSSSSSSSSASLSLPPSLQLQPVKLPCSFSSSSSCIDEAAVLAAVAAASSVVDDEEEPVLKLSRVNSDEVSVSTQESSPPTPSSVSSSSSSSSSTVLSSTSELDLLPPTLPIIEEHLLKFDGGAVTTLPAHSRTHSDSLFCTSTVFPLSSPIILSKHFSAHPPSAASLELNDFFQLESI